VLRARAGQAELCTLAGARAKARLGVERPGNVLVDKVDKRAVGGRNQRQLHRVCVLKLTRKLRVFKFSYYINLKCKNPPQFQGASRHMVAC